MSFPPDILLRRPEEGARRVLIRFIDDAERALLRLAAEDGDDALHKFRVAIRRARATDRAWKKDLGDAVLNADRAALKSFGKLTNEGRDAEVLLALVTQWREQLSAEETLGADWLIAELRARCDAGYASIREGGDVRERFEAVAGPLRERLSVFELKVDLRQRTPAFGRRLGKRVRKQLARLVTRLESVHGLGDLREAHAARISCKRLRYLVEPLQHHDDLIGPLVSDCKDLQDLLGDLQDAHVLGELLDELSSTNPDVEVGLAALRHRAAQVREELIGRVVAVWHETRLAQLTERATALAASLSGTSGHLEIERKYLLSGPPTSEILTACDKRRIVQGWLPGGVLQERVRMTEQSEGGERIRRFRRTVKHGRGITRIELEEDCDEATFETLWTLTEGLRVEKTRYLVPHGNYTWEIDVFSDRDLVLAEVELEDPDDEPEMPSWLADLIVRDVTGESDFVNRNLAE